MLIVRKYTSYSVYVWVISETMFVYEICAQFRFLKMIDSYHPIPFMAKNGPLILHFCTLPPFCMNRYTKITQIPIIHSILVSREKKNPSAHQRIYNWPLKTIFFYSELTIDQFRSIANRFLFLFLFRIRPSIRLWNYRQKNMFCIF